MENFRDCYVQEKRKFNLTHSEEEWLNNRKLIPEYIEKQLEIIKEQKLRVQTYGDLSQSQALQEEQPIKINKPKSMEEGYF